MCKVPPENHRRAGSLPFFPSFLIVSFLYADFFFRLLLQIENSFSLSVPIFKQFHKNIIGKGGANIKKARLRLVLCVHLQS